MNDKIVCAIGDLRYCRSPVFYSVRKAKTGRGQQATCRHKKTVKDGRNPPLVEEIVYTMISDKSGEKRIRRDDS